MSIKCMGRILPELLFHGTTLEWVRMNLDFKSNLKAPIFNIIDTLDSFEGALNYPRHMKNTWTHCLVVIKTRFAIEYIDDVVGIIDSPQVRFKKIPNYGYYIISANDLGLKIGEKINTSSRKIRNEIKNIIKNHS